MSVIFDTGDIDEKNHWYGEKVGCIQCHYIKNLRIGFSAVQPDLACNVLYCEGCGNIFAKVAA